MDANEALNKFLSKAILRHKRNRYLTFAAKAKTQIKFLDSIYHDLEGCLDHEKRVDSLPESALSMSGFRFEPPDTFGEPVLNLIEVCDSSDESFLVVSRDGRYAIHGPEDYIDDRAFYAV